MNNNLTGGGHMTLRTSTCTCRTSTQNGRTEMRKSEIFQKDLFTGGKLKRKSGKLTVREIFKPGFDSFVPPTNPSTMHTTSVV